MAGKGGGSGPVGKGHSVRRHCRGWGCRKRCAWKSSEDSLVRREQTLETEGSGRRPESCPWHRRKWELEKLGRQNLGSSRIWLPAVWGALGSQDDAGIKRPEGRLVPFSEKVNPGPSCYTGARDTSPGALGLHLGPARSAAFTLPFTDSDGSPSRQLQ